MQFLERRPDLMAPVLSDADAICLAIATALAEEEARQSRRPTVAPEGAPRSAWLERARIEGLQ